MHAQQPTHAIHPNSVIGTIPPEYGNVKRMRRFQVEHNRLRGRIPESFGCACIRSLWGALVSCDSAMCMCKGLCLKCGLWASQRLLV